MPDDKSSFLFAEEVQNIRDVHRHVHNKAIRNLFTETSSI